MDQLDGPQLLSLLRQQSAQLGALRADIDDLEEQLARIPKWSKAWDLLMKATVPLVMVIGTWAVGVTVRVDRLEHTTPVTDQWLRADINELKALLLAVNDRLRDLEKR